MSRRGDGRFKPKEPKEPKSASGPFHFFLDDFRAEVKKSKTVVIEPKDMIKKCTERWHKMKERDKMKYKIMSMADHKREKYERKIFNSRCKELKVEVNKPKRCRAAFLWFIQEKMKENNSKLKSSEHIKILHQQYKDLSEEEKRPYLEMEERDRERNKEEVSVIRKKKRKEKKEEKRRQTKEAKKKSATYIPHERIKSNEYVSDSDSD